MNKGRLSKVINNMDKYGLDQLLVTSTDSIYYLLDEKIHPGERMLAFYINKNGDAKLFLNELFPLKRDLGVSIQNYNDTEDPIEYLASVLNAEGVIGIDKEWPSHFLIRLMKKMSGLKIEVGSIAIDEARMIKDQEEIIKLRKASEINDKVIGEVIEIVKAGTLTEVEVQKQVYKIYEKYGASEVTFTPLICYGENAAEPHHGSDDTRLGADQSIIIDIGGVSEGYCSDMTRSFFYGEPSEEYVKVYNLVKEANLAGIAAVKPGATLKDVDDAARKVIADAGYGEYFTHRTGHGIGISGHEYPDVSAVNEMPIEPGMAFSIEPGIYIPGKYGVRIEDLVIATEDGCEVINKYSKDLEVVSAK